MAAGDVSLSGAVISDIGDLTAITTAIENIHLDATTDKLIIVPLANGTQLFIGQAIRAAS